jgi:two-component system sensor histidine kinase QseC
MDERATPVPGDADLLDVALRNLIDNAIRYSPQGSETGVILRAGGGAPLLSVTDDGPGVAEEELPRLRERFYRGTSVTAEGSGLGLTIAGRIAELHSAAQELSNRTGGGFEARIRFG